MATTGNLTHSDTAWTSTSAIVTPKLDAETVVRLETANKYVDKNIEVKIASAKAITGNASLGASATGSATISSVTVETKTGDSYPLTGSASITGTAFASTTTSGYATKDTTAGTGSTSGTASLSASLPAAAAKVTGSATVKPNNATASNGNAKVASTSTTTAAPTDGSFYIGITPSTAANTTITQSKTDLTVGYLGTLGEIEASGNVTGGNGDKRYVKIQSGSLDNKVLNSDITYTDTSADAPVLVSNDYLYINEGYFKNQKISLAQLVPDNASGASAIKAGMLSTVSAYDNDGKLVTGDIVSKTASNVDVSANGATVTATIPAGYYASEVIKDASVGTATVSGSGSKAATKPTIAAGTAASTNSQIISSTPSTTAPNTSNYYVAIKATAPATTGISVNQSAATAGYVNLAKNANIGSASTTATTGDTYYAPVAKGSITNDTTLASGKTSSGIITNNKYIKIGAGYYPDDLFYLAQPASDTAAGTITASGSASSVTVTGASIGAYNASTKTVDVTTTNTVSGTATGTGATAGYITTSTTSGAKSFTTTGKTATFSMNAYDGAYTVS